MNNQVIADAIFTHEYSMSNTLLIRCRQSQLGLKNILDCTQYSGNYYCCPGLLEGTAVVKKEEISVTETEDSVTATSREWSDSGGFGDSGSAYQKGKSKRRKGRRPYEYYCPQEGCNQKKGSYRILTPPPTCKRTSCKRYGMEMELRK